MSHKNDEHRSLGMNCANSPKSHNFVSYLVRNRPHHSHNDGGEKDPEAVNGEINVQG
tara:strand:- start:324 stop:494 length:171 start_codon:yes stop_codon:yes gene_type:complete